MQSKECAVIILNHNGWKDSVACMEALRQLSSPPAHIIIADNNSSNDSIERILKAWLTFTSPILLREEGGRIPIMPPGARHLVLSNSSNNGYAAGNNAAIRLALQNPSCRAMWILNNDTEPEPDALEKLCDRLNQRPDAGMSGSTMVYAHDRETVQCAGGLTISRLFGNTSFVLHGAKKSEVTAMSPDPASRNGRHTDPSKQRLLELGAPQIESKLDYLCGASMLIRREVFEQVGLLPEEYFLYYEDADFGIKVKKAGFSLAWAPESIVYHKEGGSTEAKSSSGTAFPTRNKLIDYLGLRNRIWLMRKHYPAFIPLTVLSYAGVIINRIRRKQFNRVPLVFKALWDGLCGNMGKGKFEYFNH